MDNNYGSQGNLQDDLFDITETIDNIWKVLKRIWVILIAVVVICVCGTTVFKKITYKPVYTASTTFVVNTASATLSGYNGYNSETASQMAKTFPHVISCGILNDMIAADLGTKGVNGTLKASVGKETNLFTLSVTSSNPQDAYDILESAIKNYPKISSQIVGETMLEVLDETGMPTNPSNAFSIKSCIKLGAIVGIVIDVILVAFFCVFKSTIGSEDDLKRFFNINHN